MTSACFFIQKIPENTSSISLQGDEHHHLSKVIRIKSGERIWLFDKMGYVYLAKVEEVGKVSTRLMILEKYRKQEQKLRLTLVLALIRRKKMELIIQKATELGVTAVIPVICSRTIIKIKNKIPKKWKDGKELPVRPASSVGVLK